MNMRFTNMVFLICSGTKNRPSCPRKVFIAMHPGSALVSFPTLTMPLVVQNSFMKRFETYLSFGGGATDCRYSGTPTSPPSLLKESHMCSHTGPPCVL